MAIVSQGGVVEFRLYMSTEEGILETGYESLPLDETELFQSKFGFGMNRYLDGAHFFYTRIPWPLILLVLILAYLAVAIIRNRASLRKSDMTGG